MQQDTPSDPPPSYDQVVGSSSSAQASSASSHLEPRNGIPAAHRRSMEDEARPLPPGWVRRFDEQSHHQFFVDTTSKPYRSIWHHPEDDQQYLNTLSPEERDKVSKAHRHLSVPDIIAMSSDDENDPVHHTINADTGPAASSSGDVDHGLRLNAAQRFGRKMKDKLTDSTHDQRQKEREARAKREQEAYEVHMSYRAALVKAMQTGERQPYAKDETGKTVYVDPPPINDGYGYNYVRQYPGYGTYPVAMGSNYGYRRPGYPYGRPYGSGYGGGYGLPLAGGLIGGLALGGLLGGGL